MKFLLSTLLLTFFLNAYSQAWLPVGGGTNNSSHGLLQWNGKLVDLGSFNNPCGRVALWDGTTWECLGGGVGIVARAGIVWNGNLVVVGDFWNNFQPCVGCNGIAMWDGTQWLPFGTGFNNDVLSLGIWEGQLIVGGDFTVADGQPSSRVVKWTGTTFESIGNLTSFDNDIRAIAEFEGELWVGGDFNNVDGCTACDGLVKWDGTAWVGGNSGVDLIGGVDQSVRVLYVNPNDNNLYMGGEFLELHDGDAAAPDPNMHGVAMYDGSNWYPLGTGLNEYCRGMHEYNGDLIVGGYFTTAGGIPAQKIARWNTTTQTWSAMGGGFDGVGIDEYVKSATVWDETFFAGGAYTQAEGGPMNYIAQWSEPLDQAAIADVWISQNSTCDNNCAVFMDFSQFNPTSWSWSFPGSYTPTSSIQHPGTICYPSPGTYNVSLQACNSLGCDSYNTTVTVTGGAGVNVDDAAICSGGSVTLTATPSVGGGTYLWSPGGETTQSITVSPASSTTYTVQYTVGGCTGVDDAFVSVGGSIGVSVNNASICSGQSATLVATPTAGGGTYLWSPGGATTQSITVSPAATTSYTVDYSLNGCAGSATGTVTVNPAPTVTVNSPSICTGSTATITATPSAGGGTYLWSPGGATTQSINVSPASTTTYTVQYTLNGCSGSAISTVTVSPGATVTVNNPSICAGLSATITATPSTGGGTYLWSPGGATTQSITVSPASSTSYTVQYTLGGCTASATSNVTVTASPTVTVNSPSICQGQSATLTATPSVGGGTYLWSPGGATTQTISVNPASTTTYTVQYSLNGCSGSANSTVTVNPVPVVTVNNPTICAGQSATILATPSIAGGTYLWSPGGETTQSIIVNPASSTSYTVQYTLNGCSASTISNVTVNPVPTVTVNSPSICAGSSATLTANPSIAGGTYLWSPGGATTQTISVNPASSTTYTVQYTLNGCSGSAISTVTVNPVPVVTVNNPSLCAGSSATITATPSLAGGTYLWSPGGQTTQSITVNPLVNSSYTVQYTLNGCSAATISNVTVNPTPTVTVNSASICAGQNATLTASPSVGGGTYLWSPGGATSQTIIVNPAVTTTYTVEYTLNSCMGSSTGTVTVNPMPVVTVNNPTICAGDNATLVATPSLGGGTYLWSPGGATSQSISVNPVVNSSYTVQYTLNGCSGSTTSNVTVNPTFSSIQNISVCQGSVVTYPDGITQTITASTSHTSNLNSVNGCDSIIVTNVQMNPNYSNTVNIQVCTGATYTYPDGTISTNITSAESHVSYLSSINGCDSTITTNITVGAAFNVSVAASVCSGDNYTYPDGTVSNNIISNETQVSTLVSTMGCDSLITTTVTVNPNYNINTNLAVCAGTSVTFPDGVTQVINNPTVHTSNLTSVNGCDSVIVTNVSVNPNYSINESISACEGSTVTYPDGFSETITMNTVHTSNLVSTNGCDSLIVTNVSMLPSTLTTENVELCTGANYTYPDGAVSTNITSDESHTSNLLSVQGCDSVVVTNITITNTITVNVNEEICSGSNFTYPDGTVSNNITTNESHTSNLISVFGCDSVIITNLQVNPLPDATVSTSVNNVITANQFGAQYQWLDCNNGMAAIPGETNQSYSPAVNGVYAVTVTLNGCEATSDCEYITTIGIKEIESEFLTIHPNPVSTKLHVTGKGMEGMNYAIIDVTGKVLKRGILSKTTTIDVGIFTPGVYFIGVNGKNYRFVKL